MCVCVWWWWGGELEKGGGKDRASGHDADGGLGVGVVRTGTGSLRAQKLDRVSAYAHTISIQTD